MVGDKKRRIALIGPAFPYRGGIAHFSNRLAQALEARFDVRLLTFSRQYPKILFPGKTQLETSSWDLPHDPERLIDSVNPLSWRKSGRWLAREEPDIVMYVHWLPFFVPAYLGIMRSYRANRKRGSIAHTNLFLHNVFPHKKFPLTNVLMRRLLAKGESFFTMSPHVTQDLKRIRPSAPVYEGFHPIYDIFEPAISGPEARQQLGLIDRPTMIFFGYVRRYKGLDLLIEAMPGIVDQVDAQLIVAGEFYDDEELIRSRISDLGLSDRVIVFSDYIPNEKVHLYFSAADVVVQPYRSATPSGVAQTAYNFSKPMIVTDLGVLSEVVPDGEAGYVVPPEDPVALADAVTRFFAVGPQTFASGVERQKKRFSWSSLVKDLADFLDDQMHT